MPRLPLLHSAGPSHQPCQVSVFGYFQYTRWPAIQWFTISVDYFCVDTLTRNLCIHYMVFWNRWIIVMLLQQSIGHVSIVHMYHLFCNGLVHIIYSRASGQCSHAIPIIFQYNNVHKDDPITNHNNCFCIGKETLT